MGVALYESGEESRLGAELEVLEAEVAEKELELETLKAEIRTFEIRYLRIVGVKYAQLDRLRAQLAELKAKLNPQDGHARDEARRARTQAQESQSAQDDDDGVRPTPPLFRASEELKRLFRQIAKMVHPDLAKDEEDRARRTGVMVDLNSAYEKGDEEALRRILAEWTEQQDGAEGEPFENRVHRTKRKIASLRNRLAAIELELADLRSSDLYRLRVRFEEAEAEGRDLLAELVVATQMDIDAALVEISTLTYESSEPL